MELFHRVFALVRHVGDEANWRSLIDYLGVHTVYAVIFLIVFCETGLVVTPFLPGDSLIFAIGALATHVGLQLQIAAPLLIVAALVGDNFNYWLGRRLGPAVFTREDSKLLNKKHLLEAQNFYEKYGSKTVILARFIPIVRTFAPFVAGIGKMNYARFLLFSIAGALLWVSICLTAGYFLGNIRLFKDHFDLVVLAIIVISVLPPAIHILQARRKSKAPAA